MCDNLLAATLVTADGRVVTVTEATEPELFWGLRGGGGNFGVVTDLTLRLRPLGPIVYGGMLLYPAAMAGELVRTYREFMAAAPDEVGSGLAFITAPPEEFVPEPVRGQPVIGIVCCYAGDAADGPEAYRTLRELPYLGVDMLGEMPYVAVQQLLDPPNPKGMQNYWTADFLAELPDEAVDTLVERATKPVSPMTQLILIPGGGAPSRVAEDAMAFGQRSAPWNLHFLSMWPDPADTETNIAYTRDLAAADEAVDHRARLPQLHRRRGRRPGARRRSGPRSTPGSAGSSASGIPTNLFRHNQNIAPAAST